MGCVLLGLHQAAGETSDSAWPCPAQATRASGSCDHEIGVQPGCAYGPQVTSPTADETFANPILILGRGCIPFQTTKWPLL